MLRQFTEYTLHSINHFQVLNYKIEVFDMQQLIDCCTVLWALFGVLAVTCM